MLEKFIRNQNEAKTNPVILASLFTYPLTITFDFIILVTSKKIISCCFYLSLTLNSRLKEIYRL